MIIPADLPKSFFTKWPGVSVSKNTLPEHCKCSFFVQWNGVEVEYGFDEDFPDEFQVAKSLDEALLGKIPKPKAWKLALLTWVAVNPAVFLAIEVVRVVFGSSLGPTLSLVVANTLTVLLLSFVLLPLLSKWFKLWLAR